MRNPLVARISSPDVGNNDPDDGSAANIRRSTSRGRIYRPHLDVDGNAISPHLESRTLVEKSPLGENEPIRPTRDKILTTPDKMQRVSGSLKMSPFRARNDSGGTFGRRLKRQQSRGILRAKNSFNLVISAKSQQRSGGASPSRNSDPESNWGTPRSTFYARYNSSSSSQVAQGDFSTPSPTFTFGMPSTPSRFSTRSSSGPDMFFNHLETPPPLPPLDHPAFRFPSLLSDRTFSKHKSGEMTSGAPRPNSRSPPSAQLSRRALSVSPPKKRTRRHLKLSLDFKAEAKAKESPRRTHTRSGSKASIASSRRSSADLSAKRASLVGVAGQYDETWEVKVSKEMLRLSLSQDNVEGHASQARGGNESNSLRSEGGEARGLSSPFSFHDSSTPLQGQPRAPRNHAAPRADSAGHLQKLTFPSIESGLVINTMSDGDAGSARGENGKASRASSTSTSRRASKSTSGRPHSPPPPKLDTASATTSNNNLLVPPSLSFTAPTPEASPISPQKRVHHKSSPTPSTSVLRGSTPLTPPPPIYKSRSTASGKRKADEVDGGTPPKEHKENRATFAPEPRTHRASAASSSFYAPTSFHRTKRARVSLSSDSRSSTRAGYPPMTGDSPNAKSTGSWSSRDSTALVTQHNHHPHSSRPPSTRDTSTNHNPPRQSASRRSISNHSIPMSAYMSPHAPSVTPSSTFHMRDPRKPSRIQDTPWSLSFPAEVEAGESRWSFNGWVDRGGSPLHAWLFFIGFIVFPLWWFAGFVIPIPRTRRLESGDTEKGVVLDDPQVEFDYKSWRRRCRIMGGVSLITYIPFIVLIAVFA